MRKIIMVIVLMVVVLGLGSSAWASLWVQGAGFYYSPDYGKLGEGLEKAAPDYETPKKLEAGTGATFSAGWDFSDRWGIRLDSFIFTGIADYHHKRLVDTFYFETSTSPILLSVVYRIPMRERLISYLGAGIGTFPSKFRVEANIPGRNFEDKDSPTGFQVLAGADLPLEGGLFFSGEARYISAKAEYPSYRCLEDCSTDWSGLFVSIGVGYRFGPLKIGK